MKTRLITLLLAGAAVASATAIPARRAYYDMPGPDGRTVTVMKLGDEFGHYYIDADGRKMIDDGNRLVYASEAQVKELTSRRSSRFEARNADVKARRQARSRVPGHIGTFPGTTFPATGKQKAIVILVEYPDRKFKLGSDAEARRYFTDMLNKDGFSEYGGTGSAHEYFIDSSNGQFDCQFDVFGPVTLKNNMKYYGGNDPQTGEDLHPEEMVVEACNALDSEIDFKEYDRDNDGVIDNVYVIYAGYGEASYYDTNTIWPHSWSVIAAGYTDLKYDGVQLDTYGCSNEWEINYDTGAQNPDGIGTFVHEFSHILGLPDLYHTIDEAYYTPGSWSVLDYGPYNNNGRTPPAYSAFERNALGWIDLTELTAAAGDVTLPELNASNSALVITNPTDSQEFFLLESRAQTGWDKYLPGAGMLVWHVDYDYNRWQENTVNNSQFHQYVDLVEADGRTTKQERDSGDCYPGSSKVTTCSPRWWSSQPTGITLSKIARSTDNAITFTVGESSGDGSGDVYTVSDVYSSTASGKGTVRGYIVGYVDSAWNDKYVHFTADGSNVKDTNLVLADAKDETDLDYCIPVQLPAGSVRDGLNLKNNPQNLGRLVELTGSIEDYFNQPGLKSVTAYKFIDEQQNAVEEITVNPAHAATGACYDLSGRRVADPTRGIYIIDGRKVFIK